MVGRTGTSPKKSALYGERVIRVHENPKAGVGGGYLAAAVMGANASIDFAQLERDARQGKILRDDMPTKGSGLTIDGHTFPNKSIRRFCNNGVVDVCDKVRNIQRHAKSDDRIFCAVRAWDQRSESGYMIRIENQFQRLADGILAGHVTTIDEEQNHLIDNFYALWYYRSRLRYLPYLEHQLNGVDSAGYTKEQEEALERDWQLFVREGGRIPARQLNGLRIQFLADNYARQIKGMTKWRIITPQEGEFIVPDIPNIPAVPLTPTLCLFSTAPSDGMIVKEAVADFNRQFKEGSWEYFFARDLAACP
jgi:hypothetical protein